MHDAHRPDDRGAASFLLYCQRLSRMSGLLLAFAIGFSALASPASAQTVGDRFTHQFPLVGKQVPLPGGEWVLAGLGTQPFDMPVIGAYGTIQTAVLFLTRGDHIDAVLEINTNTIPVNDGWGRTKACADGQQFLVVTHYQTGWETSCAFVEPTKFGPDSSGPPAWEQARNYAREQRLIMPTLWLTAGFRVSDRQDLMDARYHFAPELSMGANAEALTLLSDWSPSAVSADPVRAGAVQLVSGWANGFGTWIERGLHNQIDDLQVPLPETAAYRLASPFVDAKLRDLDRLYGEGRISWDAYLAQSRTATAEIPVYRKQSSLLSNSVQKNLSFRFFGTFVDYAIAYVVTANTAISTGIALTINSTDSVWFVLNDRYWDDYYAKLNTHDSERIVDFTYIGGGAKI